MATVLRLSLLQKTICALQWPQKCQQINDGLQ